MEALDNKRDCPSGGGSEVANDEEDRVKLPSVIQEFVVDTIARPLKYRKA